MDNRNGDITSSRENDLQTLYFGYPQFWRLVLNSPSTYSSNVLHLSDLK